jgi:hypothetical protein
MDKHGLDATGARGKEARRGVWHSRWPTIALVYASWTMVGMGLRLAAGAFDGNLLWLAAAFVTWVALAVGVGIMAISAVFDVGSESRKWVGVVVAAFVLLVISRYWIDRVGDALFEDIQRTKIPYYEEQVKANWPEPGAEETVFVDEESVNVIVYDSMNRQAAVLLLDARRRQLVWFEEVGQPRAPRLDNARLRHLEGNWYWAEPFK